MTSGSTPEELESLRRSVRGFLGRRSPMAEVRRLMETDEGFDPAVWTESARQLGVQGLTVPEPFGGAGYGLTEQSVVLEELGRAMAGWPYFSSAVMATSLLTRSEDEQAQAELLPPLAAGERRAAAAVAERGWEQGLLAPETSALPAAGGWQVTGGKALVLDGLTADLFLVTARTLRGVALFAVDGDAAGIERVAEPALDLTRKQARVTFARTPARLVGREGGAEPGLVRAWDVMLAALAAEQVGGAQRCLEMIVEYLKVRVQFGRLLGSFQALKHRCANLVVEIDSARALAGAAAVAADEEDWPRLATLAALAKADCSEVFAHASAENVQLHGGIGFTWEHDAHLYFKRARASQYLFGEPSRYRERAAVSMGL